MCGIGIDTSVASAEEALNAIKQQSELSPITEAQVKTLESCIPKHGQTVENVCRYYKVTALQNLTVRQFMALMRKMGEE